VVKKHDFCSIQRKIPQNSDFAKKRDLNPVPNGEVARTLQKCLQIFFAKIVVFCVEKHDFCGNLIGRPQNSLHPTAKIGFHKKLLSNFRGYFLYHRIFEFFCNNANF
jgi:hypothetical protein